MPDLLLTFASTAAALCAIVVVTFVVWLARDVQAQATKRLRPVRITPRSHTPGVDHEPPH